MHHRDEPKHNPDEAPVGFYAFPKSMLPGDDNRCHYCDWRPQCNDPETDLLSPGHRCMSYPVIAYRDGKTYQRLDGVSVVFKRRS